MPETLQRLATSRAFAPLGKARQDRAVAGRKPRGRETAIDMVLSMGAVFVAVAIILLITYRSHDQVKMPVDLQGALAVAKTQDRIPVLLPNGLPENYQLTSARFEPESYGTSADVRWYLGYQTEKGAFISLWQSTASAGRIVMAAINGDTCDDLVQVAGAQWQKCSNVDQQSVATNRALVRNLQNTLVVVSGTASWQELEDFAKTLRPLTR